MPLREAVASGGSAVDGTTCGNALVYHFVVALLHQSMPMNRDR
jgi:hypothetical protein